MTTRTKRTFAADRRRNVVWRLAAPLGLSAVVLAVGMGMAAPATATGNTLRVDPAVQTVPQGGTFTAHVVQSAGVPTSGAATSISFDPALLQIQSVARGAPYASAQIFNGASPAAIAAANTTGSLAGVAAAFLSPDNVAAGAADFLDITFKAVGCGTAELGLPTDNNDPALLDGSPDTYGNALQVTAVGGSVTTCVAATPTPVTTPTPTPVGSLSPSASPSPSPSPTPPPGNTIRIEPATTPVAKNGTFSVRVVQHGEVAIGGITATIVFDPTVLKVLSVTPSAAYTDKNVVELPALSDGNIAATIANANLSGSLKQIAATFKAGANPSSVPAGDSDFITVEFQAIGCGKTPLLLPNNSADSKLLDGRAATYQKALAIRTINGAVQACGNQTQPPPSMPAGNSIRVEPYRTGVIHNGGLAVRIVQHATVASGGTTATIVFDPTVLRVDSVTYGAAFANAPIKQGTSPAAIAAANASGKLNQVTAAFVAPLNAPAGDQEFITVNFKAITCGTTPLLLPNDSALSAILDGRAATYGQPLTVSTLKGVVQACAPGATPTTRPTPTPRPTADPTPVPTVAPTLPPTGGDTPPPVLETPTPEPAVTPAPTVTPRKVAVVVPVARPTPRPSSPVMTNVAFVGLGVAGVIAGLAIILALTMAMIAGLVIPLLLVRARTGRRQR